jgi:hypothetical protein
MSFWFISVVPKYLNFATFSNDSLAILIFWSIYIYIYTHIIQIFLRFYSPIFIVRCAAMKFPEWFYSKYVCILTAYWDGSPSRYPPFSSYALGLTMLSLLETAFSAVVVFSFWMSLMSWNLRPVTADFIFGKRQKSTGAISGEWGSVPFQ